MSETMSSKVYVIRTHVKYTTGGTAKLEYLVLAPTSVLAVDVLLKSVEFPRVKLLSLAVDDYYGKMVIDRNE